MKVGKEISIKVVHAFMIPTCRLEVGAILSGHVTEAIPGKGDEQPQLGIVLEQAECGGKGKQELPLRLISLVAAAEGPQGNGSIGSIKIGRNGGQGTEPADVVDLGDTRNSNREKIPDLISSGSVQGVPGIRLDPSGGPACSALLSSAEKRLHLPPETKLLLVVPAAPSR